MLMRDEEGTAPARPAGGPEGDAPDLEAVVEGLLFVSGEALPLNRIAEILEIGPKDAKILLDNMAARLERSRRGLLLREANGKYQLCTRPELGRYIGKLFEIRQKQGLSQAAYETLAIIAYNAGVTRAVVEKIRGVNSDSSIAKLLERNLIAESGRLDLPGRPMTYDVTDEFYKSFGFKSKRDLPDLAAARSPDPS
jgi:segregation and condensation protein B